MIFKLPALREEIGDPLDICSVNCDNSRLSTFFSHFLERVERR